MIFKKVPEHINVKKGPFTFSLVCKCLQSVSLMFINICEKDFSVDEENFVLLFMKLALFQIFM